MNTRSCERVNGLAVILRGYALHGRRARRRPVERGRRLLLRRTPGRAARRVLRRRRAVRDLPHRARRVRRVPRGHRSASCDRYLPFLATTKVLMAAVRDGVGRETAHEAIKEHAVARRAGDARRGRPSNDLFDRLAADPRLGPHRAAARRPGGRPDRRSPAPPSPRSTPWCAGSRRSRRASRRRGLHPRLDPLKRTPMSVLSRGPGITVGLPTSVFWQGGWHARRARPRRP